MNEYTVPELSPQAQAQRQCPHCQRRGGQIHGHRTHRVEDTHVRQVGKLRMRCAFCKKNWTCQPEGLDRYARRSRRVKALNVLLYTLGLSYRGVCAFMSAMGVRESPRTVLDDVRTAGERAMAQLKTSTAGVSDTVRVVGIDGTGQHLAQAGNPHAVGVLFVVSVEEESLLDLRLMEETDAEAVGQLIEEVEARFDVKLWVSDEHPSYARIAWERHLLCTAHFKKSKRKRIGDIRERIAPRTADGASSDAAEASSSESDTPLSSQEREQMARDLDVLDRLLDRGGSINTKSGEKVARIIHERWMSAKAPGKGEKATLQWGMRQLALDLWNNWSRAWEMTNNATERVIGRALKVRSKMMRGFKVDRHILLFSALGEMLTRPVGTVDLAGFV